MALFFTIKIPSLLLLLLDIFCLSFIRSSVFCQKEKKTLCRALSFVVAHQKNTRTKMTTTRKPSTTAKHQNYVSSSGTTRSRKPLFRPTAIADVFWTLLDVLVAFLRTLFSLEHAQKYGTKAGDVNAPRGGGGGGNNGTRRYGGSNIHGIDHNATPPSA